ncbi:hypothetical protein JYT11_00805 [Planctomycetaceae bacterium AH-315-I19]|nr:hypothetical protein [Planctomycetaceae bacterium AH-315-I19]
MSAKKSFGIFWKVAAVAVLALIAAVAWLVASFDEQVRPVIAINYAEELASLAREYQPESGTQPNRRDEFIDLVLETQRVKERAIGDSRLRITRAIDSPPEEEPEPAASPFGDGDPTFAEDREVAMDYLAALDQTDFYARAAALPGIQHSVLELPTDESLLDSTLINGDPLEHISAHLSLGRILTVRAVLDARAGETDAALERLEQALATARLTSNEPFLLSRLVTVAIEIYVIDQAVGLVADHLFSSEQLDELTRIVNAQRPTNFEYALRTEQMIALDLIQRVYSDNGSGDGVLLLGEVASYASDGLTYNTSNLFNIIAGKFYPSRRTTTDAVNGMYDAGAAIARDPSVDFNALREAEATVATISDRVLILGTVVSTIARIAESSIAVHTWRGAFEIVVALEHYFVMTGTYPESLDALVPEYLPSLPLDHLAADGRFIYALSEDGNRAYTLYSVGKDGIDNGGGDADFMFVP